MTIPSDLERAVEELSELIEAPIDPETIMSLREKVTNKTVSNDPRHSAKEQQLTLRANRYTCRNETRSC